MGLTFAFGRGGTRPPSVTPDIEAPSAPTGLTASSVAQTTLTLTWSASTDNVGVVGYDVYNGATLDKTVTGLTTSITGLTANTQYNFTVRAKDAAGNISEPSNVETVTTLDVVVDDSIYIDPTNSASGRNGTISNPYNSFVESGLLDSTTYKVKSGTTLTTSAVLDLSYRTDTFITSYGVGAKPIFNFTASGTCAIRFALSTRCTLDGLEVTTPLTNSLVTLINGGINTGLNGGTDNWITNCKLHNVKQGSGDGGMGIRAGGTNWKIVGCEFYNIGCDGMYLSDVPNLFVNNCNLYLINQNYAGASKGFVSIGNGASGDGIQLGGNYNNFYIGNTTIDRSDPYTGNKFCIIFNSGNPLAETWAGVVEHCTFKTNSSTAYAIDHVRGTGVIFRYNKFNGSTVGVRLEGALVHDTLFHHNIFVGCTNPIRIGSTYSGTLGPATGTKVYNNVFYGSLGAGTALSDITLDQTHVDSCNNIHYNTNSAMSAIHNYGSGVIDRKSNNCYYGGITSGFGGDGVNPVTGNPLFVDAANGDFHLQAGSSCRNSGIDVGLIEDYYGTTIPQETVTAIGAAEYNI